MTEMPEETMRPLDHTPDEIAKLRQENAQLREERDYWHEQYQRVRAAKREAAAKAIAQTPEPDGAVHEIFAAWQRLFGYGEEKLTKVRRAVILARLRDGYTVEQIVELLTWASTDPWTRGTAPKSKQAWDDLTNILRPSKFGERLLRAQSGRRIVTNSASLIGGRGGRTTVRTLGPV